MTQETSASSAPSTLKAIWLWLRAIPTFLILGSLFLFLRLLFSRRSLDRLLKWECRALVRLLGIRVHIEGQEHLDLGRPYTFMINHVTAIDHLVVYGVLPHFGRGLEAAENFRIPFYGWVARSVGNYPIARKHPEKSKATLELCRQEAKEQGFSVYCAPEGTRSPDGLLGPLKSGVFRLALACNRDIVPVALIGLHAILPRGEWRPRPQAVTVRVLQPIPVCHPTGKPLHVEELKSRVRDAFSTAGLLLTDN